MCRAADGERRARPPSPQTRDDIRRQSSGLGHLYQRNLLAHWYLWISATVEQPANNIGMAVLHSIVQRGATVGGPRVDAGTSVQQQFGNVRRRGHVQRSGMDTGAA